MQEPAFNARFRIMKNQNRKNDRSPEHNIAVDFTPEQAMAAANWLQTMAEQAHTQRTTVRVYRGRDDYQDVPGFTLWGGLWGNAGSFSPLKPDNNLPAF